MPVLPSQPHTLTSLTRNAAVRPIVCSGLVTFIAAYHCIRNYEAYSFPASVDGAIGDPVATGVPFNDAYRYMHWLLSVHAPL